MHSSLRTKVALWFLVVVLAVGGAAFLGYHRISDLIRGRHLPEAAQSPLLADPHWATRQRGVAITRDYAADRDALAAALLANARGEPLPAEVA